VNNLTIAETTIARETKALDAWHQGNPSPYKSSTAPNGKVYSPFSFNIDPMERLILVNFEKDPDEFYTVFEFQQACDIMGRKHLLVIAYRRDDATDVYYQEGYPFGSQDSVLNNACFFIRPLENARFEVNAGLIDVYFAFEDKMGREIIVQIKESKCRKKNPFFLLAPVGANSEKPMSLPVYSLYQMSFLKQKHSVVEIEIDKVKHKPDTFPLPVDCAKNYFTRYSADTFNVDWNKNFTGQLSPLIPDKVNIIEDKGIAYEMEETGGHYEIKRMSARNSKHHITIEFSPAFPDIICLREGTDIGGNFSIITDNTTGSIGGHYRIKDKKTKLTCKLIPMEVGNPGRAGWF